MLNQKFHLDVEGGVTKLRTEWGGPDSGVKYESEVHFGSWEVRQFLEPLGEWGLATISKNDSATTRSLRELGFQFDNRTWYVAGAGSGAYVRDDSTVLVLLPEQTTWSSFWKTLGLHINLNTKEDGWKTSKYLRRLFSHHAKYIQGTVVEDISDTVIKVRLDNGKHITVRNVSESAITDGMNLVSRRCLKMLDYPGKEGTGLRITGLSPKGFSKGHAIVLKNLAYDLVLFGSKSLLTGDRFTFSVDDLHSGNLFTDSQSIINFRMEPFLMGWAETFMKDVVAACESEEEVRRMLNFYDKDFHIDAATGEWVVEKEKEWALTRAIRNNISLVKHPKLRQKLFSLFTKTIMNCETDMRIPIPETEGNARYMLVDPTVFDIQGNPLNVGVLEGNQCWVPKHEGPVAFYRQPNGHRDEHAIANSVKNDALASIDTGSFMFISRDVVIPILKRLGGGDQDDRACYITKPEVVEHFRSLPPYPKDATTLAPLVERRPNRFRTTMKPIYDGDLVDAMLAMQEMNQISIGQAVNPIMVDTALTDNKERIINQLLLMPNSQKVGAAITWADSRPDNVLAPVAWRLEDIIDSVKKNGVSDNRDLDKTRLFNKEVQVIPACLLERLPASRQGDNAPVVVLIELDDVLQRIHDVRVELEDYTTEHSWDLCVRVPLELETAKTQDGVSQLADAIKSRWLELVTEYMRNEHPDPKFRDKRKAAAEMDLILYNTFKDHPFIMDAMVWLYGMTYQQRTMSAPLKEDGRPKQFPDAVLWGNHMSGLTVSMLEFHNLTCKFAYAELDHKYDYRGDMTVHVDRGVINKQGTDVFVGMVDPMADGATEMKKGFIATPAVHAIAYQGPSTKHIILDVVGGLQARGASPQEIADWKKKCYQPVMLVPYEFINHEGELEHAVKVLLLNDGGIEPMTPHGNISRRHANQITETTYGDLAPGSSPLTLTVVVKVGR